MKILKSITLVIYAVSYSFFQRILLHRIIGKDQVHVMNSINSRTRLCCVSFATCPSPESILGHLDSGFDNSKFHSQRAIH